MEKLLIISSDADALGAWRQGNDPMNLPSKVGKGAILVISTDAEVRGTCRQALEGENVSVLSAAAITDAMGTAKGRTVDVVLVDAEILGDRAGEDIFEKFREENHD